VHRTGNQRRWLPAADLQLQGLPFLSSKV